MDGLLDGIWASNDALAQWLGPFWLYAVVPLVLAAAIVCAVRFGAAPFARFAESLRSLRHDDREAFGTMHPLVATGLSVALVHGALAFVGTATAIGLGGVGVLPWTWLACLAIAFVRIGELALARTSSPGKKKRTPAGSLSARLEGGDGFRRPLGFVVRALAIATAVLFLGAAQGLAVGDAVGGLVPGAWPYLGVLAALIAVVIAATDVDRVTTVVAIVAGLALLLLFGIFVAAGLTDTGRFFGALGSSFGQALGGMPAVTPHSGAFLPEMLIALVLGTLPPLFASTALDGAIFAGARAKTTRSLAGASWIGPLAYGLVATVVGLGIVATGAYYKRVDDARPLSELAIYKAGFETASQRIESSREFEGLIRLRDGTLVDPIPRPVTERATVRDARYYFRGEPADIALRFEHGRVAHFYVPRAVEGPAGERQRADEARSHMVSLEDAPLDLVRHVEVRGRMLPLGGKLLGATLKEAFGSDLPGRLALAALLLLTGIGAGAAGGALRRMTRRWHPIASYAAGSSPGLALCACVLPSGMDLHAFGLAAAGLSAVVGAIGVAALGAEAAAVLKSRASEPTRPVATDEPPPTARRPKSDEEPRRNVG
jgi:Na+/alanine symporter